MKILLSIVLTLAVVGELRWKAVSAVIEAIRSTLVYLTHGEFPTGGYYRLEEPFETDVH